MSTTVKWADGVSRTTGISAETIAAGANNLGDEIDNSLNKDRWMTCELTFTCSVLPTAGKAIELYILYAVDGTNYEDGDATPTDPSKGMAGAFFTRAVTTEQKQTIVNIPLMPFKFKILLKSELDQSAGTLSLLAYTHNEEA